MLKPLLASLCLLLCSCSRYGISVENQFMNRFDLASYHLKTPDPCLNCPPLGQRLLIAWDYPSSFEDYHELQLRLTIRYKNYEEETLVLPIRPRGNYIFEVLNDRYFSTRGIQTYKIDLLGCYQIIDTWRHQLWVELIDIKDQ